ncbi:hypothetical protein F5B20DRAFT_558846 [Whalleya microplaca]|nr:hypothetical protein F5B20DRAFT_558846 [Whalleya microplaca]
MDLAKIPIVQYNVENKNIPGDPTGWKMKDCGNIAHWNHDDRYLRFPRFKDSDFDLRFDPKITAVKSYLASIVRDGVRVARDHGTVIRDTDEELVIQDNIEGFAMHIMQLKDVSYKDKPSYTKTTRSKKVEELSSNNMTAIEPAIDREMVTVLMAQRMYRGEASSMPMHRPTAANQQSTENRKGWYKSMRQDAIRTIWVEMSREQRDAIRAEARNPPSELEHLIQQIREGDTSRPKDYYWQHLQDEMAAKDPTIYDTLDHDIVLVLDKDSAAVMCKFRGLFQFLFGEERMSKVDDAVRQWSSFPPLPLPDSTRHMVDKYIRKYEHPEMDLEKAQSLEEIEARHQCVVHYGTWAMQGHRNPKRLMRTPDTMLRRGAPRSVMEDDVDMLFPIFIEKAAGIGSEVVRYLFSTLDSVEYAECCEVFKTLPSRLRMGMSEPTFSTLFVLGINSYTGRHRDSGDVDFGLPGLVALGNYDGGHICFPQLALRLPYQPGDSLVFRGSELEHFVSDWSGYRIFMAYTNHQPVRNYAYRMVGKLPPKPNDEWHPDRVAEVERGAKVTITPESEPDIESYDPCYREPVSPEPEELWEADIHGSAYLAKPQESATNSSLDSSQDSKMSRGRLIVSIP